MFKLLIMYIMSNYRELIAAIRKAAAFVSKFLTSPLLARYVSC